MLPKIELLDVVIPRQTVAESNERVRVRANAIPLDMQSLQRVVTRKHSAQLGYGGSVHVIALQVQSRHGGALAERVQNTGETFRQ